MKKFFGCFFIVLGVLNFVKCIALIVNETEYNTINNPGGALFMGIGLIGLGIWMIQGANQRDTQASNPKENQN